MPTEMNNQAAQTMPETFQMFVVYTNTDLTEGRGYQYPIAWSESRATAVRLAHKKGVMGSDAEVREVTGIMFDGRGYGPVRIEKPTDEDRARDAAALSQTAWVAEGRTVRVIEVEKDGASRTSWSIDGYGNTPLPDGVYKIVRVERPAMIERAAMLAAATAASGGECTNPAPGHDAGEDLSDYVRIAHLIGSIFFYGNFKAETFNERELESLLRKVGRFYESEEQVISGEPAVERPLHFATENLIRRFSDALREKLSAAEKKYGYSDGWASPDWMDECRKHLMQHIAKGDPRDVAAYCAFLWHHGESTTPQPPAAASGGESAASLSSNPNPVTPSLSSESAASVSERARVDALALDVANRFTQDTEPQRRASLQVAVIAAIEQALTQQRVCATCGGRGEIGGHVGQTAETFDYVTEPCPECTTPQPSADAVRELVKRWRDQQITVPPAPHGSPAKSYNCALRACAYELESLLSGGPHA